VDADACVTSLAGKAETEKTHPPRVGDPAFLFVYLHPQRIGPVMLRITRVAASRTPYPVHRAQYWKAREIMLF